MQFGRVHKTFPTVIMVTNLEVLPQMMWAGEEKIWPRGPSYGLGGMAEPRTYPFASLVTMLIMVTLGQTMSIYKGHKNFVPWGHALCRRVRWTL